MIIMIAEDWFQYVRNDRWTFFSAIAAIVAIAEIDLSYISMIVAIIAIICFSNRSVAKVSFKMFSLLSRMLMLQKRQWPAMFLFCYRPNFNEKWGSLEFVAKNIHV